MDTSILVGVIGTVVTAIGVIIAVVTIFVAVRIANVQKDVEAILKLSSLLTAWHDDVIDVIDQHDLQKLRSFMRNKKYPGQVDLLLALLSPSRILPLFQRSRKYRHLVHAAREFEETAVQAKAEAYTFFELERAQINRNDPIIQKWLDLLSRRYDRVLDEIIAIRL